MWEPATQVVFSSGASKVKVMLVGEQSGDIEDRKGVPFVGPAGCDTVLHVPAPAVSTIYFEDLVPGRVFELGTLVVDEAEMVAFAERFDPQWYHVDRARAEASTWGRLIASGFFTVSSLMRMYVDAVLSRAAADTSPGMENLRWFAPVYAGDELSAALTVTDAQPSTRSAELGTVFLQWQMHRGTQLVLQMSGRGWFIRRHPLIAPAQPPLSPLAPRG